MAEEPMSVEDFLASLDTDEQMSQKLLRRLAQHGLGVEDMAPSEITAAREYLARTAPPKKSVELAGAGGGPLTVEIVRFTDTAK